LFLFEFIILIFIRGAATPGSEEEEDEEERDPDKEAAMEEDVAKAIEKGLWGGKEAETERRRRAQCTRRRWQRPSSQGPKRRRPRRQPPHRTKGVVPVISRGVPPAAIHVGAAHYAGNNTELFMTPAGRMPGKTVGTSVLYGQVWPARKHRRSAIHRQSLRLGGGTLGLPGIGYARQENRRTIGSRDAGY
jgi:hypothetical protein